MMHYMLNLLTDAANVEYQGDSRSRTSTTSNNNLNTDLLFFLVSTAESWNECLLRVDIVIEEESDETLQCVGRLMDAEVGSWS